MGDDVHRGLEGVLVAESELSDIDGENGELVSRGYPIRQLARECTFEETLNLLWGTDGRLPKPSVGFKPRCPLLSATVSCIGCDSASGRRTRIDFSPRTDG